MPTASRSHPRQGFTLIELPAVRHRKRHAFTLIELPAVRHRKRYAFTLIELLVVIAIIVLLISILLPVVATVRIKAQVTQTQAEMDKLRAAIMNYYHDWNTYPGPLANTQLVGGGQQTNIPGLTNVTSTENLALGLLGYLDAHYNPPAFPTLAQDPTTRLPPRPPTHDVLNLNPLQPKTFHYIDFVATEVSNGFWVGMGQSRVTDTVGNPPQPMSHTITDTIVPEFLDTINTGIGPMPILYIRANAGAPGIVYAASGSVQNVPSSPIQQYDVSQLTPYGFTMPNTNDFPVSPTMTPQSPWTAYMTNANIANTPRGKDGFILISAGADRLYGTSDDIIVTP